MSNILISGGSGMIGKHLISHLNSRGHKTSFLSRSGNKEGIDATGYKWDPYNESIDEAAFENKDAFIHLAGAGIADKRWTDERKHEIYNSRIKTTQFLLKYLKQRNSRLKTIVSASAIGYYGDSGDKLMKEDDAPGKNFLSKVCEDWEREAKQFRDVCDHLVILRLGIVLSKEGGALPETLNKSIAGIVSYLGNGKQYYSWIHFEDLCRMFSHVIENHVDGIFNAVAPEPVTNREFTKAIRSNSDKIYAIMPAPAFAIKIALGEMATMVLDTQRCSSDKIEKQGFEFQYSDINSALQNLL